MILGMSFGMTKTPLAAIAALSYRTRRWRVGGEVTQRIANPYPQSGATYCKHKKIRSLPFWKTARTYRDSIRNLGTGESRHD